MRKAGRKKQTAVVTFSDAARLSYVPVYNCSARKCIVLYLAHY